MEKGKGINLIIFSQYRKELMGIAILGVLFSHLVGLGGVTNPIVCILSKIMSSIAYTEGFLLLSGFGLFYSFNKRPSLYIFYKNRCLRLIVPFLIMSIPFYLYVFFEKNTDIYRFVENITATAFWIHGNNGMWYISITIVLYILFPFLYCFMFRVIDERIIIKKTIIVLFSYFILLFLINMLSPTYYNMVKIGINQVPMFFIGMYFGYKSIYKSRLSNSYLYAIIFMTIILFVLKGSHEVCHAIYVVLFRTSSLLVICSLLYMFDKQNIRFPLGGVKILGEYTLELYILHLHLYGVIITTEVFDNECFGIYKDYCEILSAIILAIILAKPIKSITNKFSKLIL